MKLKIKKQLINEYLQTKEDNIIVDNIINDYLTHYRLNVTQKIFNKHFKEENFMYKIFKDLLDVDEDDVEFDQLAKDYKLDNIKELNNINYTENEYYKNFKDLKGLKYKNYELCIDEYKPHELFLYDDIDVLNKEYYKEINNIGYFRNSFPFIALKQNNITWMSITPHEINTMKDDINSVKGNVLILGLGLGYFSYMASLKDNVTSITIIEKDKNIIDMFNSILLPNFPYKNKIKIVNDDAIKYLKQVKINEFDYVYCDLYHNPFDALSLYIKTKQNESRLKNTIFLYWIEKSILALVRRCFLTLVEENQLGYIDKNYKEADNDIDKFINSLYFYTKDISICSKEQLDYYLSDDYLKEAIKHIVF